MEEQKETAKAVDESTVTKANAKGDKADTTSSSVNSKAKGSKASNNALGEGRVSEGSAALGEGAAKKLAEIEKKGQSSAGDVKETSGLMVTDSESTTAKDYGTDFVSVDEIKKNTAELEKRPVKKKSFLSKVGGFLKKNKGKLIFLVILIIGGYIFAQYKGYEAMLALKDSEQDAQYGTIERRDIVSKISTTGTIQSVDTRTITSPLSGVKIAKVNYEVGDMVTAGDVIVEFSRDDIQDAIDQAAEDLSEAQQKVNLENQYQASVHYNDYGDAAYSNYLASTKTQTTANAVPRAQEDLAKAQQDKQKYVDKYKEAVANIDALKAEYADAQATFALFKATQSSGTLGSDTYWSDPVGITKTDALGNPLKDENGNEIQNSLSDVITFMGYQYSYNEFSSYISSLNTKILEYESTIKNYDTTTYDKSITTAERNLSDAQKSYSEQLTAETNTNRTSVQDLTKSDYNYNKYNITANDEVTKAERSLKTQQDKLDDYVVYAPISGLVTSVSAQEGNGYNNTSTGGLMTIQDIDSYQISAQIDEYDINNVVLGQRVVIMTDATGDDEFEGMVSFISPTTSSTATASTSTSNSSSSSSSTYEVKIDIISVDSRLRLGMSAKINIIIEQHAQTMSVPYDAINEAEDGQKYIMIASAGSGSSEVNKKPSVNSNSDSSTISVVATDGTVTNVPSSSPSSDSDTDEKTDFDGKGTPPGKSDTESVFKGFWDYLFTSKEDRRKAVAESEYATALKKTYVTIGLEDDYYTEIEATGIHEGDEVVLTQDDDNSNMMFGPGMGGPGMGGF